MPATYEIIKDIGLVVIVYSGPPDPDEFIGMLEKLYDDPDFLMSYDVLMDLRDRTGSITSDELKKIAGHMKSYTGDYRSKRAFLVSKTVDYGMIRVYEALRDFISNVEIDAFIDKEKALDWLGLQDHPLFVSGKYSG
jgi:hypothetical protein